MNIDCEQTTSPKAEPVRKLELVDNTGVKLIRSLTELNATCLEIQNEYGDNIDNLRVLLQFPSIGKADEIQEVLRRGDAFDATLPNAHSQEEHPPSLSERYDRAMRMFRQLSTIVPGITCNVIHEFRPNVIPISFYNLPWINYTLNSTFEVFNEILRRGDIITLPAMFELPFEVLTKGTMRGNAVKERESEHTPWRDVDRFGFVNLEGVYRLVFKKGSEEDRAFAFFAELGFFRCYELADGTIIEYRRERRVINLDDLNINTKIDQTYQMLSESISVFKMYNTDHHLLKALKRAWDKQPKGQMQEKDL